MAWSKATDRTGTTINNWLIKSQYTIPKPYGTGMNSYSRQTRYKAMCIHCKQETEVTLSQAKKSTGKCWNCMMKKAQPYGDITLTYFARCKKGAKEREITFDVTIEYLHELYVKQEKKCALTGWDIGFCPANTNWNKNRALQTASLDRIDSSRGYVEGNLQWLHKEANSLKLDRDEARLIEICGAITAHHEPFYGY